MPLGLEDNKQEILERYAAGETAKAIAPSYGCSRFVLREALLRWGTAMHHRGPMARVLPQQEIIGRYNTGETPRDIAKSYDVNASTIRDNLQRWGVQLRTGERWAGINKQELTKKYAAGESTLKLAALYGCSPKTICLKLQECGVELRARKYTLDENFFDVIDTEAKAYFLGFILADGSITKNKRCLYIELQIGDIDILRKFAKAINFDKAPTVRRNNTCVRLFIGSAKFCSGLLKHGCIPNKTYGHPLPIIPEHLKHHYFRGYYDGDGCLYRQSRNSTSWVFKVIGTPALIKSYQDWLVKSVDVAYTQLECQQIMHDKFVNTVRYSGGHQVERIVHALYQDATIFLNRKHELYLELCAHRKTMANRTPLRSNT